MGPARGRFERIGITGYPESHHLISDEETIRAMFAKAEMATHIVSQLCFDPATVAGWIANVRARGTHLPIWIGMPGCVDSRKLVRVRPALEAELDLHREAAHRSDEAEQRAILAARLERWREQGEIAVDHER